MLHRKTAPRACARWPIATLAILISGCISYNNTTSDLDRTPIVNTGARATIIYPNQSAPAMPGSTPPQYPSAPSQQQPAPGSALPSNEANAPDQARSIPHAAPPPEGEITFLGGARTEETAHVDRRKEPMIIKYITAPFKLAAAPFVLAKEAIEGDPEPGPEIPRRPDPEIPSAQAAARPSQQSAPPALDYESARLAELERQLDQRSATDGAEAPQHASARGPSLSIADELRELQRSPDAPQRPSGASLAPSAVTAAGTPPSPVAGDPFPAASGIVDRNNDGRIDQWIFRENGEIAKEILDENFDGRPDRTIAYDPTTHRPSQVEEDTRGDGAVDSWTNYENGSIARRRSDSNGDGTVDTWSFFRDGVLARHEQDTDGDGFRDVVSFFDAGRLVREEHDVNGDAQPDAVLHYDANEQLMRREEDRDGDGVLEVVSHYEAGRLVRRELLDAPTLAGRHPKAEPDEATR